MNNESVIIYAADYLGQINPLIQVIFFTAIMVVYSIFVFFFYRYLAKKNIINLNLRKYNYSNNPGFAKFFGFLLYLLEYIFLLPIVAIFWFGVISLLLLVLAKNLQVETILIIGAALISSVRITSYISEKLSQDLAKMVPFIILTLAITGEHFFSINEFVKRFTIIPEVIPLLPIFIIFIIAIEIILRVTELVHKFLRYGDEINEEIESEQ